jgi:hypothetical protein
MGKHLMERAGHGRRVMGVVLAAMLVMTMAATAAFADEHDGVYPPFNPDLDDSLVCTPEEVEPGGTVTCTASEADGVAELEVWFGVMRLPAGLDDDVDWDELDELDDSWFEEIVDVQDEFITVDVDADGTAVFSFVVSGDARDGDVYEVYAWGAGPGEDCFVFDNDSDEIIGHGALEDDDGETFVIDGIQYSWDDAYYYCDDDFEAAAFGGIVEPQDDGEDVTPTPVTPPTTPAAAPKLPTTGASTLLLAVLGMVALGGGATAVAGSRRLARRDG